MRKISIAAALSAALISTIGMAQEPAHRFTRDGATYVYTKTALPDGRTVLEGRRVSGGTFRLVVDGNRVTGKSNGVPVSFRAPKPEAEGKIYAAN